MKDLNKTLEEYLNKALKVVKKVDRFINGVEKQLVIEVGSHTTKVVEYVVKDKEIEVTGGALLNTPINSTQEDRLIDINALANVLEQALKEEKIKTKEFVASIVSKEIIIREMNAPNMKERELQSFVQINSKDIFPVKLSNYVLAYHIIEKGTTNRIMIAAIPRDIIEGYIQLADRLGLNLKGINYSGYELYNFLDFEIGANMSTYLAFDIGAKNTNIVIISNGILKFNKIIPKGSEETSKFISEEFGCSLTKAEQMKRQYNTIKILNNENLEEKTVVKYTQRCIENVLQDLQRIIEFFNSNNPKTKITKVYVLGVTGKINGIEEYFSNRLNIETKSLKLFDKVEFGKKAIKIKARQHSFINTLGAQKLKDRDFYFIKGDLGFKKLSFIVKPKFHKIMFCAILIFIAVIVAENNSVKEIDDKIDYYNNYVRQNSELLALRKELDSKERELLDKKNLIDSLGTGIENEIEVLNAVDEAIVEINQINDASMNIVGWKFQRETIDLKIKIQFPEMAAQFSLDYYYNIPFNFEEKVANKIERPVEITSNVPKENTIEFNMKITLE